MGLPARPARLAPRGAKVSRSDSYLPEGVVLSRQGLVWSAEGGSYPAERRETVLSSSGVKRVGVYDNTILSWNALVKRIFIWYDALVTFTVIWSQTNVPPGTLL